MSPKNKNSRNAFCAREKHTTKTPSFNGFSNAVFRPSAENRYSKTLGRSPDLQRPCLRQNSTFIAYLLPSFPFFTVKGARRSYGCGGSGATRKNPFSLFPIKPSPQGKYHAFVFGYSGIIPPKDEKVNTFSQENCTEK